MPRVSKVLSGTMAVQPDRQFAPLPRPQFQLDSLPARFRWEVTRRHPYYLTYWTAALNAHRHEPCTRPGEEQLRTAAILILQMIGIGGEPIDPATAFDAMGAQQLHSASLTGSVQPLTLRQLATLLIDGLPQEVLGQVGLLLCEAACTDDPAEPPQKVRAKVRLATMGRELDAFPTQPYVRINPAASSRQLERDVSALLKSWKRQYGLTERRERSDRDYRNYLEVWDSREGWTGREYESTHEQLLKELAVKRKTPLATVTGQYQSAFEMITGHPYTPETWFRVFGPTKLSALWVGLPGRISRRRPLKSKTRRAIPQGVLQPRTFDFEASTDIATGLEDASSQLGSAAWEQLDDIRSLVKKRLTDDQIVVELELPEGAHRFVAALRERFKTQRG